jgi:predicted phosphodiesterase
MWESKVGLWRQSRFGRDGQRPKGTTKVYALSDVHFDHPAAEEWVHGLHATRFLDDVLIIAGNLADSLKAIQRALIAIRSKFRRVFYVPGNHEMWINRGEASKYPDSFCKLWALLELCDELDIEVAPAAICKDVYIVPLFSWYNIQFDKKDPFPDPKAEYDKYAKWPIDPMQQVWRYMLALNRRYISLPYHGTVITFSHFVPRHGLPTWREKGVLKVSGCEELDEQIRDANSICHVYGHTHYRHFQSHENITYVHRSLEFGSEGVEPLMCIFNGERISSDLTPSH